MPNHIHLLAIPSEEDSLARALGGAHAEYALTFNRAMRRSGHLWQNRFFSCPLDRHHLRQTLLYIERNPVRAHLVEEARQWPSAARWEPSQARLPSMDPLAPDEIAEKESDQENRFSEGLAGEEITAIRRATRVGEPLGSEAFVRELERRLNRRLRVKEPGRPRKSKTGVDCELVQETIVL